MTVSFENDQPLEISGRNLKVTVNTYLLAVYLVVMSKMKILTLLWSRDKLFFQSQCYFLYRFMCTGSASFIENIVNHLSDDAEESWPSFLPEISAVLQDLVYRRYKGGRIATPRYPLTVQSAFIRGLHKELLATSLASVLKLQ